MKHIIIDTNVFARYFVRDIVSQYEEDKKIFSQIEEGKIKGKVSILVIDELIWVLENYYELSRHIYIPQMAKMFSMRGIQIMETKKSVIMKILEKMQKSSLDFTDLYLSEVANGEKIVSFDRQLTKRLND